ncbi:MAG: dihydrolipoyl dehydrogenase [Calditrichaeota bacterium]|nr:dihydrolipoyl dehydrogenase [Calditrichota bacterium]
MSYDIAIIGAGPGGYVCALRSGQLGLKTLLIDPGDRLGGTCLNVGCIPSKALLEASEWFHSVGHKFPAFGIAAGSVTLDLPKMLGEKERIVRTLTDGISLLMKKQRVEVIRGRGRLAGPGMVVVKGDGKNGGDEIAAKVIVLATGSVPVELPFMPFDGKVVVSSTEALAFDAVPDHLVVVGAGAVGLELGSVWNRLGAKVTVVEMLPAIAPFADRQLTTLLQRSLTSQGLEFRLETQVTAAKVARGKALLTLTGKDGREDKLTCDKVLVAVGRKPFSDGLRLEEAGVTTERGRVVVDDRFQTSVEGVYAIGDLIRGPMLAHKASEEGVAVAELVAGHAAFVNYDAIPNVIYTAPELAVVGLSEEEATQRGHAVKSGKFFFRGNGRALSLGEPEGLVKVVADATTDRVLGIHILGPRASDMIAEAALALEFSASSEDLGRTIHAHPTLSEAVKEAALAVNKMQLHG